ncbi:unnamed protein product [Brassicogethes aeneus]|uniref:Microtubule-associated protein n=1 Tax=Brassicogethes aeneus TaxID=1431903 RepID=A0A9P0B3L7_BRAAE|nr:unnamed protein product [Brassicogethes aeneus]
MQQTPNPVINGPTIENKVPFTKEDSLNGYQDVSRHPSPQPQNGSPGPLPNQTRPPLIRLDSRSTFPGVRPGFPNPGGQIRPQPQIRPGGVQAPFVPRNPLPQGVNRPPGQPPFQQQQSFQQYQQGQFIQNQQRPNFRPPTPFPRPPQGSAPRPQGIFPQRSAPPLGLQRSQLSEEELLKTELQRSQTLDPGELSTSQRQENEAPLEVSSRPNLAAMKNRSYSLQSNSSDQQDLAQTLEERRRSVASVESLGEKDDETSSRPESRMSHMNKILEDDDDKLSITSNISPSSLTDVSHKSVNNDTFSMNKSELNTSVSGSNGLQDKPQTSKQDSRPASRAEASRITPKLASPNKSEGDNDSGVDESTQGNEHSSNGDARESARKVNKSRVSSATPTKGRSLSRGSKSPASLLSPDSTATTPGSEKKKVPMNKVQVGSAPSPNLKVVRSKIGSLDNASYKPSGGKVKIESKKIDFKNVTPRIEAKNDRYTPRGGDKKIASAKLQWNAKSKIGSLENATYKPKGGDKKIESVKLDFKDKAKSKVGSTANLKHVPGGGDIKIETKKIELNVTSKIGSLNNVKHKPGGGDKKIFDDKEYLKQKPSTVSQNQSLSGSQKRRVSMSDTVTSNEVLVLSPTEHTKRYLVTISEETTLGRAGSIRRQKSAPTPRPTWKF